jgi:hypothetical protein
MTNEKGHEMASTKKLRCSGHRASTQFVGNGYPFL